VRRNGNAGVENVAGDGETDGRTDGRTDGHTLLDLQSCAIPTRCK